MTVIAAARTKKHGIVIASDSEVSWWAHKDNGGTKLAVMGEDNQWIAGLAGGARDAQVFEHFVDWPQFAADTLYKGNVEKWAVRELVPRLQQAAIEHGILSGGEHVGLPLEFMGAFILATEDTLMVIDGGFYVHVPPQGRFAVGSGANEAFGHLGDRGPWTKSDVIGAARAARVTAHGVGGPVWVVDTKDKTIEMLEEEED